MQKAFLLVVACLSFGYRTMAQVTVQLTIDGEQFIPGQSVQASVRIINRSGELLKLGSQPDWLIFTVEGKNNAEFEKNDPVPVQGEFALETAKMATKSVKLTPHFSFNRPGRFQITAAVRIPEWNREIRSDPETIQVTKGTDLRKISFGVPGTGGPTGEPEMRKYVLVKSSHIKGMELMVQVYDAREAILFKVAELGQMVSFSEPETQLDRFNNLHVLWQIGSHSYVYAAVNPQGLLFARETYDFTQPRPKLVTEGESGRISVKNGTRRKTPQDVPPE